jgi:hypothetical protein
VADNWVAPALLRGCSKLNWFEPCLAIAVIGLVADVLYVGIGSEGGEEKAGIDECRVRMAIRG